ncbi:hypothetical protein [Kordiimonas marina]|uniref:hypothetical protein n=1 Tax=Kordiimonas marina TaxID=2872312 RepID=UPI001FF368DF|nr:hypothetical protein [Kordiimonas marina]MCJ9427543.1 hypothetical protein [Kordiimonas marina]
MSGGNKRFEVKNWRHLLVLALVAALFFGGAYWMATKPAEKEAENPVVVPGHSQQPLADTTRGRQVKRLLADESFQKKLPEGIHFPTKAPVSMPAWVGELILYALVGLGIFTIAVFIWVLVTGNTKLKPAAKAEKAKRQPRETGRLAPDHALAQHATLEDAKAQAAEGNFGDAVRALLAVSLISLSRRELVLLRPWMTGREIVRDAKLFAEAKKALEGLVFTVESYAFAGEEVRRETYEACLLQYDLLMQKGGGA